ncbi:MAG: PilZ domain-containing protein [Myxococcota bacterium]
MVQRPSVLLVDEGELEDVSQLLVELRADTARVDGVARPEEWPWPSRLLIASARRALALGPAPPSGPGGFTAIAIADDHSKSLRTLLRRMGFDYLVRRPVHPEALKLLFLHALYTGRERRHAQRFPVGSQVACRTRWRRWHATLAEISPTGCRLLAPRVVKVGKRLAVSVPRELGKRRRLTLRGRVVRSTRRGMFGGPDGVALVVVFENLDPRTRESLSGLLGQLSEGPVTLPQRHEPSGPAAPRFAVSLPRLRPADGDPPADSDAPAEQAPRQEPPIEAPAPEVASEQAEPDAAAEEPPRAVPAESAPDAALDDARRHPRKPFAREVVALDEHAESVLHVLAGRDLSVGGMRVEPHPAVEVGDRLRLAIYDACSREALIVNAEVAHDDGGRGLGLHFVDSDAGLAERVEAIVAKLPSVEALDTDEGEPHGVVMAQILTP